MFPPMGKKVVVYTTTTCPFCRAAKELLRFNNVTFQEIDVTDSPQLRKKLVESCNGRTTVPQIFVDDRCIGGYRELVEYYETGKTL